MKTALIVHAVRSPRAHLFDTQENGRAAVAVMEERGAGLFSVKVRRGSEPVEE